MRPRPTPVVYGRRGHQREPASKSAVDRQRHDFLTLVAFRLLGFAEAKGRLGLAENNLLDRVF